MAAHRTYINRSMSSLKGGKAAVAGLGQRWTMTYSSTVPSAGHKITLVLTDNETAEQVLVGAGRTTGIVPTYAYTYNEKVYLLAGSATYFSEVGEPTSFNPLTGVGNGFVQMSNQSSVSEDLVAMAPFQGRLAFFSRNSIYIWSVSADPAQWQLIQTLKNVGAVGKYTVQPKGDLDVMFLSDTGVRSLLSRDSSLNGYIDDVGSPIDSLIQAAIRQYDNGVLDDPCAVVDPGSGRYWLFIGSYIYVHSYFPSSKVSAWSMYVPTDSSGATFVPTKMFVYAGQVHVWDATNQQVLKYGGADRNTYDTSVASWTIPWVDLKSPGRIKTGTSLHALYSGHWKLSAGMDAKSQTLSQWIWNEDFTTVEEGIVPFRHRGQYFCAHGETDAAENGPAVFSSLTLVYEGGPET